MDEIRISKHKLLKKLKENRNDHRAIFELALDGWKKTVIQELENAAEEARTGRRYKTHISLPVPVDHTGDYDEIIDRVEWHESDFIELDHFEFNRYVRDCWDWQPDFINTATTYSSSSSSSSTPSSNVLSEKIKSLASSSGGNRS